MTRSHHLEYWSANPAAAVTSRLARSWSVGDEPPEAQILNRKTGCWERHSALGTTLSCRSRTGWSRLRVADGERIAAVQIVVAISRQQQAGRRATA